MPTLENPWQDGIHFDVELVNGRTLIPVPDYETGIGLPSGSFGPVESMVRLPIVRVAGLGIFRLPVELGPWAHNAEQWNSWLVATGERPLIPGEVEFSIVDGYPRADII